MTRRRIVPPPTSGPFSAEDPALREGDPGGRERRGTCETPDRRTFVRMTIGAAGALILGRAAIGAATASGGERAAGDAPDAPYDWHAHQWAFAVDTTRCIGCGSCMRACRAENRVPDGAYRTWVERYEIDAEGEAHVDVALTPTASFETDALPPGAERVKGFFVPKLCNHCEVSVCSQVCPVGASYETPDGVVLVDRERCIGCAYCVQACPYGTRFINHATGVADKCTFCYHRITRGEPPACVLVCPVGARMYGDLRDHRSGLYRILRERRYTLLKPELGTHPKCYYVGLDLEVR